MLLDYLLGRSRSLTPATIVNWTTSHSCMSFVLVRGFLSVLVGLGDSVGCQGELGNAPGLC